MPLGSPSADFGGVEARGWRKQRDVPSRPRAVALIIRPLQLRYMSGFGTSRSVMDKSEMTTTVH